MPTHLATTNTRSPHTRRTFGIKRTDRRSHLYIIGKTGTGKTTLLKNIVMQDMERGEGLALLDPHGDMAEDIVAAVPPHRQGDLIYLDVPDPSFVWHFNPLTGVVREKRALAAAGIVEIFKKLWSDGWGARLEHLLRNVVFTLLETPGSSLGDIPRLLSDKDYRRSLVSHVENKEVQAYWRDEFAGYSDKFRAVVVAPLQNKVGAFLTDPLLRRILTGSENSFDLREIMDSGKLLVVNLAKGKIGEGPASLLGSLLVSSISFAGLERADVDEDNRLDFHLFLDEFHTFSTLSLATMLSELRKYRVNLVLANQYLSQLEQPIRDAVLGNAGTLIAFRVGGTDAPVLAREFSPTFGADDLVNLPNFHIYLKLMIDGQVSRGFSGVTIPGPF